MKKLFILHVLLCFWLWNYAQSYEDYSKVSKIGYSTNYSNGQFNSGIYKSSMPTLEYQNRAFIGTYNPSSGSSGGSRQGDRPRRVVIKDGDSSIDTGRDNDYNTNWDYYHGRWSGSWYYRDGDIVYVWNGNGWEEAGTWNWFARFILGIGAKKIDDKNISPSVPIGDAAIPLFLLLILYLVIKKKNLSRENC